MLKRKHTKHIDKKILMRARIFAILSVVFIVILLRDLFIGMITLPFLIGAFIVGIAIGMVASRMFHLSWNHDGKKVIGRLDGIGIAVLVLYIAFAIFRQQLVGIFIHGPMLGTVTLAVMGGLFVGQIVGIRNGIAGILKAEGITK